MIQFNLLPDIKVEFIKAKKAKRTVIAVSVIAVAVSLTLLVIMVSATLFQKHHISDLDKSIKSYETDLQNTKDLSKILTIQNQLNTLPTLYAQRPVASRLFGYIEATTPSQISMTRVDLDFTTSKISVQGTADSLESVNKYVDTLKFTTYTMTSDDKTTPNAFPSVVLSTFNRDSRIASFTVDMSFDPVIFDSGKTVKLKVPSTITTRSETELPGGVFDTKGSN